MSASGTAPQPDTVPRQGRRWWLLPLIAFVVGLVLGGLVIATVRPTVSASPPESGASTQPGTQDNGSGPTGTGPPAAASIAIPEQCLKLSDDATVLDDLVQRAAAAARDLNASELSDVVREIDAAQRTTREHAAACREMQGSVSGGTATTQPMTDASPSPSVPSP